MKFRTKRCRVKDILLDRGMTQKDLAIKIGFSKSHVSDIVHHRTTMRMDTGMIIAKALNVTLEELYEWEVVFDYEDYKNM